MRRWLEPLALVSWGSLPWLYASQHRLTLLVRQEFIGFALVAATLLILLGLSLGVWQWRTLSLGGSVHRPLLPGGSGASLLLLVVLMGILFPPQPLSSKTALNRGGVNLLQQGRLPPQRFQIVLDPSQRSLVEWVRTFQAFPDPQSYVGQAVNIDGFVIHPPDGDPDTFWLTQFVIGCCAADAYPVGFVVQWPETETLLNDTWQRVQGRMALDPDQGLRVRADRVEAIPTPENPFG